MEKFLEFWSHYNATIIEGLVALILISVIFLAYRMFFGSKGPEVFDAAGGGSVTLDTSHIEKTLQKILDQQQTAAKASPSAKDDGKGAGSPASAELIHEVSHLKKTVEEKDRQIVQLKTQVDVAEKLAAQSATAAAAAANGAAVAAAPVEAAASSGLSEKERQDYEAKIKELEARLAEYEIISEDIADVSFFKEENARLNSELEALRSGGAPQAAAAPAAAAFTPAAAPVVEAAPAAKEPDEALLAEFAAQAPAAAAPAIPEASAEAASAIDDSLMAEFARAVEGQKEGTLEESAKTDEDAKLLEEFENFSKKG
jgi:hypothetical protein